MLDVPTLAMVAVFVTTILGLLLMFAWRREQNSLALRWWGTSYLLGATSFGLLAARGVIADVFSIEVANTAILLSYAFLLAGARSFNGRDMPAVAFLVAPLIWLTAMQIPAVAADINLRIIVVTSCQLVFVGLITYEFWRERAEPLLSRWPAIVVLLTQMVALSMRLPVVLVTPLRSSADFFRSPAFAVIAFGTVLYTITFAFLLLSIVKERGELRHKTAALVDSLTGLANRRAFLANADEFIGRAPASRPFTAMLADLDRFKDVNDRYGHATGDRVLQIFAETLLGTLRPHDLSGRLGGEEFAILMPNTSGPDGERVAERIRTRFAEAAQSINGHPIGATVSVGVATVRAPAELSDLMVAADRALYLAKAEGRDRIALIDCDTETGPAEFTPSIVPEAPAFLRRPSITTTDRG